jgi:hypothetical protein
VAAPSLAYDVAWMEGYEGNPIPPLGHDAFVGWFDGMKAAVLAPLPPPRSSLMVPNWTLVRAKIQLDINAAIDAYHRAKTEGSA